MNKIALAAILAVALIGLVMVSGCLDGDDDGTSDSNGNNNNGGDGDTATADELSGEIDQNLIDEDEITEIGDMV